jgi:hypothetical protein
MDTNPIFVQLMKWGVDLLEILPRLIQYVTTFASIKFSRNIFGGLKDIATSGFSFFTGIPVGGKTPVKGLNGEEKEGISLFEALRHPLQSFKKALGENTQAISNNTKEH